MYLYIHEPRTLLDSKTKTNLLETSLNEFSQSTGIPIRNLAIEKGKHGKPFLVDGDLEFSVTHTRGLWMCLIGDEAVGIDAERIDRKIDDARCVAIAKRFFTKPEVEYVEHPSGSGVKENFFNIWTRKEAFIKYTGRGLGQGIESFNVLEMPGFKEIPISPKVKAVYYTHTGETIERWVSI